MRYPTRHSTKLVRGQVLEYDRGLRRDGTDEFGRRYWVVDLISQRNRRDLHKAITFLREIEYEPE